MGLDRSISTCTTMYRRVSERMKYAMEEISSKSSLIIVIFFFFLSFFHYRCHHAHTYTCTCIPFHHLSSYIARPQQSLSLHSPHLDLFKQEIEVSWIKISNIHFYLRLSVTFFPFHTLSLSLSLSHTHTHTYIHTYIHTHTLTHSLTLTHSH